MTFDSMQPVVIGGAIIVPDTIRANLDGNGQISVQLPSTNDPDLSVTGWTYTVTEHMDNGRGPYQIEVPYTVSTLDLATIPVATPNPSAPSSSFLRLTDVGIIVAAQTFVTSILSSIGSSLVGFIQAGIGAVARTVQDRLRDTVHVKDFGAIGDGASPSADTAAVMAAIAHLQSLTSERGGRLRFTRGAYKVNLPMEFTASSLVHGINIVGDGDSNTSIDFSGLSAGQDGISFDAGAHFGIRDIFLANAPRNNITIGRGTTVGGGSFCSVFSLKNVRSQGAGQDGVFIQNAYLGTLKNVWSKNNSRNGFTFAGFHTSIKAIQCEASDNAAIGYSVNGMVYSSFTACGSDANGTQGWALSNLQGVTIDSCGAESNQRDGWLYATSDASATGLNAQSTNIRGVEMVGCYGLSNSLASAGTYATFVNVVTANSRSASLAIRGGVAHPNAAGDRALIVAGTSGAVTLVKDGFDDAAFSTADSTSGTFEVQNRIMSGRRCLVQTTAQQSIPDATDTTINVLNTTPAANDLGATVSTTAITIPRGVSKVVVSANFGWEGDASTGQRTVKIFKNGSGFVGMPSDQRDKTANQFMLANLKSAPVSVVSGDTFSLVVSQTSGAARNTLGTSNSMWLCVEAIS